MAEPLRLRTVAQFRSVVSSGGGLVITDVAGAPVFHPGSDRCGHVREIHFETKVIANGERNGSYFAVPSFAEAEAKWPNIARCRSAGCAEVAGGVPANPLLDGSDLLRAVLGAATGSEVRERRDPPVGVEALMSRWATTQRIALGERDGELMLCAWPGELKPQAQAVYGTGVGAAIVELAERSDEWVAEPLPHLAFNGARREDRFYFRCPLPLPEYVARWSRREDLAEVGGHPADSVRAQLWPWLCERGYADPDDPENGPGLDRYMEALERRRAEANLRPSIALRRSCPSDSPEALRSEAIGGVGELARVLREAGPEPSS